MRANGYPAMNCPECSIKLRGNGKSCSCGWSIAAEAQASPLKYTPCSVCHRELPWPTGKQVKNDHRIIGYTSRREPICNKCYESGADLDWRSAVLEEYRRRHKDDHWGALACIGYSLKGAPREDCAEFIGYLKDEVRKAGGLFGKLPYDKTRREPS